MGMIKGETEDYTEGDMDMLYLSLAWHNKDNDKEYVSIGVVEKDAKEPDGTISLQIVHFPNTGDVCKLLQANLLDKEIDMVIEGLQKAKTKMTEINKKDA